MLLEDLTISNTAFPSTLPLTYSVIPSVFFCPHCGAKWACFGHFLHDPSTSIHTSIDSQMLVAYPLRPLIHCPSVFPHGLLPRRFSELTFGLLSLSHSNRLRYVFLGLKSTLVFHRHRPRSKLRQGKGFFNLLFQSSFLRFCRVHTLSFSHTEPVLS